MPAKAALGPPLGGFWGALGGSWGRLGAPLAPLGALLGLPGGPGAPRRLAGELREAILGGIFKFLRSAPGAEEKTSFLVIVSCLFASMFGAVFCRLLPSLCQSEF